MDRRRGKQAYRVRRSAEAKRTTERPLILGRWPKSGQSVFRPSGILVLSSIEQLSARFRGQAARLAAGDMADPCVAHQAVAHTFSDDLRTAVFRGFQCDQNVEQVPFTRSTSALNPRKSAISASGRAPRDTWLRPWCTAETLGALAGARQPAYFARPDDLVTAI